MTFLRPTLSRIHLGDDDNMNSVLESILGAPNIRSASCSCDTPGVDIVDSETGVTIYMEMAGVEKNDIKVSIEDNTILITASRKKPFDETKAKLIRSEIYTGEISRNFNIARNIDTQKIRAEFKNGLLIVNLPKVEQAKPKEIDINIA